MALVKWAQNEDLAGIGQKLAEHLAKDTALIEWCHKNFGKNQTIVIAPPQEHLLPRVEQTPYIALHDFRKAEGKVTKARYQCILAIGIDCSSEDMVETGEGILHYAGQMLLSEYMTLIEDALFRYGEAEGNCHPVDKVEAYLAGLVSDNPNHWEGFLYAVWELPICIGSRNIF